MTSYMDTRSKRLVDWLKEGYVKVGPHWGWPISDIATGLRWSVSQVHYTIDYTRNERVTSEAQIVCWKPIGKPWHYKYPTPKEAAEYLQDRGGPIATQFGNMLLLSRKGQVVWGDAATDKNARVAVRYFALAQRHLIGCLREMDRMEVPGAYHQLVRGMRAIESSNGQQPAA